MANEQNLLKGDDLHKFTHEEASKGGKKSAESRREKKLLRELLEEALLKNTKTGNRYIDITNALIKQAEDGNVKAYETIRDTLGQKPVEQINHSGEINNAYAGLTEKELRKLAGDE